MTRLFSWTKSLNSHGPDSREMVSAAYVAEQLRTTNKGKGGTYFLTDESIGIIMVCFLSTSEDHRKLTRFHVSLNSASEAAGIPLIGSLTSKPADQSSKDSAVVFVYRANGDTRAEAEKLRENFNRTADAIGTFCRFALFHPPRKLKKLKENPKHSKQSILPASEFARECLEWDSESVLRPKDIHDLYVAWCHRKGVPKVHCVQNLFRDLRSLYPKIETKSAREKGTGKIHRKVKGLRVTHGPSAPPAEIVATSP